MEIEPRRTTQTTEAAEARRKRLQAELERLRALLAADPRVRRLVVFGSFATGETHEWSDLDVAVVMDTDARFSERAGDPPPAAADRRDGHPGLHPC
jgi:predicted nucleotidyltransferase